jgi:class 3 adenylate cyclase/tetratricopeptide (TPR) repeat protein
MRTCSGCGAGDQPDGARFCFSCGAALAAPTCPSCGAALVPGARFCSECGTVQAGAPPTPDRPVSARRVTSVLFGDLVGFTALSESRDQEDVRELLSRYFDECRRIISRYGGTVEKFIGDAVMAVWGVPTAHEDDAERSVRAGLELVNTVAAMGEDIGVSGLAMRVGIVTGEVAVTVGAQQQGMVAGDAVNTASRVQSVAGPGQVWVDETTRLLTSSSITYVDAGTHHLKGKVDPVPLWSVRAVVAGRGGGQRADGLEAPLVGRDRELRLVKELFHVVQETGRPSLVIVDGDPGVGKSRLSWEFEKYVDGLTMATRWHDGRCVAYGEGVAFYALAEAVRGRLGAASTEPDDEREPDPEQLLDNGLARYVADPDERAWLRPRLGALLGIGSVGTYAREDLFSAWATFLQRTGAGAEAVVLVIEDAQHADEGLLAFLEHLLAVGGFPCFVLMLTRPGLLEAHAELAANRRTTVLHLPTLSPGDMSQLLGGLVAGLPDDVRRRLVERAEGVPLFAVETVRSLIDRDLVVPRGGQYVLAEASTLDLDSIGAPASLQALISARLDTLSAPQRQVVDRASVLGGSFHRDELAEICPGVPDLDDVLAGLVRLQILSRESSRLSAEFGQYQFVQSAVRQVAYATLSRRDRKATHLAVVELLLAEVDAAEDVVPMVARHYLDALEAVPGDPDVPELKQRAIAALERAAARSSALGSPGEAAGHLAAALAIAEVDLTRARLTGELAESLTQAGRYEEAVAHAAEAVRLFDELGDDVAAGVAAATQAAGLLGGMLDSQAAAEVAEPRWAALEGRSDAAAARLALAKILITARRDLGQDSRELMEQRLRLAEEVDDEAAIADTYLAMAIYYSGIGISSLGKTLTRAGADLARAQHRPAVLARALVNLTSDSLAEDLRESMRHGREALDVATAAGNAMMISFARVNLILALLQHGAWAELAPLLAEEDSEQANAPTFLAAQAAVAEACGRSWELPWSTSTRPWSSDAGTRAWQAHCESRAALREGDLPRAAALGVEAAEVAHGLSGLSDDFPYLWADAADVAVRLGDRAVFERLSALVRETPGRVPPSLRAHLIRAEALWAWRQDPADEQVPEALRTSVDLHEAWGSRVHRARAEADLGVWLTSAGRAAEAEPLLGAARELFAELGAVSWADDLQARLASYRTTQVRG